jgi:hypothetical protein
MTDTNLADLDLSEWDWPEIHHLWRLLAEGAGEYAGIPVPIHGHYLHLEDRYPNRIQAQIALDLTGGGDAKPVNFNVDARTVARGTDGTNDYEMSYSCSRADMETYVRNAWYSRSKQANVYILQQGDKFRASVEPVFPTMERLTYTVQTMDVAQAWDLNSEVAALGKLKSLVEPHLFAMYFMTGAFVEISPRSGVTYILRRSRPTIATVPSDRKDESKPARFLAALCLHPLGYYAGTWAGAMVPTDDVIAHLLMIRGDEHLYWRRANQHPAHVAEAAL